MYGKELILDLSECNLEKMTKESIDTFLVDLCELIDMERVQVHYWTDEGIDPIEYANNPHLQGCSVCQFIKTSSIVVHAITGLKKVFLNIFSCKNFSAEVAEGFAVAYFEGDKEHCIVLDRI